LARLPPAQFARPPRGNEQNNTKTENTTVKMIFGLVIFLTQLAALLATSGVDVSQLTSTSSYQCLVSNGYSFAVPRVYQSSGKCDPNGKANINNARSAGVKYVDGYIFPCYSCGNPAGQVNSVHDSLGSLSYSRFMTDRFHSQLYQWC
jgi:hypothetical protein